MAEPSPPAPLRLTFAFERLSGPAGGAEKVLRDVACEMAARGHVVEVLSTDAPGETPFHAFDDAVRLTPLGGARSAQERAGRRLSNLLHRLGLTHGATASRIAWVAARAPVQARADAALAARPPDVAIGFTPNGAALLSGAQAQGARLVASLHNAPDIETAIQPREGFLHQKRLGLAAVARADLILALLGDYLPALEARFPGAAKRIMPNAIEGPATPPPPLPARPRTVLCVGRLSPEKRQGLALEAWARLAPDFPGWRLEIYGGGADRAGLEARIARLGIGGSAALRGTVQDIDAMYAGGRLMAHPAAHEGFPLAVGEALARGVPVVGFADCSGLNAMVKDGETGLLVPPGEDRAAALAEALGRLMRDDQALARLSRAGPASMAAHAMGPVGDLWEAALREALGR